MKPTRAQRVQYGFDRLRIPFVGEHIAGQIAETLARDAGLPPSEPGLPLHIIWSDIARAIGKKD